MKVAHAYAPGRVEILGNHTDYNEGLVLAAAIDRGISVEGEERLDGMIVLKSEAERAGVIVPLAEFARHENGFWANYPLGVVAELLKAEVFLPGFSARISGTLPPGAGLSSSAALEVATAKFLLKLTSVEMDPLALAKLCQRAENLFVGVQSGLLDQVSSIFGKADHFVHLDCRSEEIQQVAVPDGYSLVIADSGDKHSLEDGIYNCRREECREAAASLGVGALRDVDAETLALKADRMPPLPWKRAMHVVGENERVKEGVDALKRRDVKQLGVLMNRSHESSRIYFENSTPSLDRLVRVARELPGVLGARLTGGGFGGSAVLLVENLHAAPVVEQIPSRLKAEGQICAHAFVCRIADGAR